MQQRMRHRTGLALPLGVAPAGNTVTLTIGVKQAGAAYPKFGEDESYALTIDATHATLQANTTVGAHARHGNALATRLRRCQRLLPPAGQYPGQATLWLARPDDRRGPPLRAG